MIPYLPHILGIPLILSFTAYVTGKFVILLGRNRKTLNPLAIGNPETLANFKGDLPHVVIIVPSYNDKSVDEALPK